MVIIYHNNCNDGFCAAWLLSKLYPDARFIPMNYGEAPPDVTGANVIIADFSFKRDILLGMKDLATSLIVLDHHKTAQADCEGLDFCVFDMNASGARLVYKHWNGDFNALSMPSWLVDYTEDRDLWRHKLLNSKEVNAALSSYERDFSTWNLINENGPETLAKDGFAILRYQQQMVNDHVARASEVVIAGHKVLAVNATSLFSEVAGALAKDRPFGVAWFRRQDGKYQFSLRSCDSGEDVSQIAKKFGGGGHRNAAGFELPYENMKSFLLYNSID